MTAFKSLLFFILAPGMVAGVIPLALFRTGSQIHTGLFSYLAFPFWLSGVATLLWCFWDFIGHFLWFGFWNLLIYAAVVFIAFNTFVAFYEEPNLKTRFGTTYEDYLKRVPRWIPRIR